MMDDLISIGAALEALDQIKYALWEIDIPSPGNVPEYIEHHEGVQRVMKRIDELREKMEQLPTAEPMTGLYVVGFDDGYKAGKEDAEPRKGKWIEHNPHKWGLGIVFECSECGEEVNCEACNYCPNCGARMEE